MSRLKSYHFVVFISFFVGLSFIFERYTLLSPVFAGPVALLSFVPLPLTSIQVWGMLFSIGAVLIYVSPTPLVRAIFLCFGASSWALFAGASLYQSLVGPDASVTGSFLGIVLVGLVFRFFVAIRNVVKEFKKKPRDSKTLQV